MGSISEGVSGHARRGWARRLLGAAVGAAVVAVALVLGAQLGSGPSSRDALPQGPTSTATVERTNLAQSTPVTGTVGFGAPVPGGPSPQAIVQPAGTALSSPDEAQQSVTSAESSVAADRQSAADEAAADAQTVAEAQQALATAQAAQAADTAMLAADEAQVGSGQQTLASDRRALASDEAAVNAAQAQLASAQQKAVQGAHQQEAKVTADQLSLARAESAAAAARASQTAYDPTSKYTALPALGQIVQPGGVLWSVDGRPVALVPGTLTPWRAFTAGMSSGPDVAALNQALAALGLGGPDASSDFTGSTAAAIDRLQARLGAPQTGTLPLGAVIFEPTAVRVAVVHPEVGATVAAGAPVLDVTSTVPIVHVALPAGQSYLVKVGDAVSVTLPDATTASGTITAVGTVATTPTSTPGPPPSSAPSATVDVLVTMVDASAVAALDQAPVTVNITSATAHDVLAVPTTALLALAGGGYAVEVVDPVGAVGAADAGDAQGAHRLIQVTTGIFDDERGMVQVSGAGLVAGLRVVAAA